MLLRSPELADYQSTARLTLAPSTIRGSQPADRRDECDAAETARWTVSTLTMTGPAIDLEASGTVEFDGLAAPGWITTSGVPVWRRCAIDRP